MRILAALSAFLFFVAFASAQGDDGNTANNFPGIEEELKQLAVSITFLASQELTHWATVTLGVQSAVSNPTLVFSVAVMLLLAHIARINTELSKVDAV